MMFILLKDITEETLMFGLYHNERSRLSLGLGQKSPKKILRTV